MPSPAPLLSQFSSEIASLVAAAAPSTVAISTRDRNASGFFWRPNGVVAASDAIDAEHGSEIEVISHAGPIRMTLAGRDRATDVAILTSATAQGAPMALAVNITARRVHFKDATSGRAVVIESTRLAFGLVPHARLILRDFACGCPA